MYKNYEIVRYTWFISKEELLIIFFSIHIKMKSSQLYFVKALNLIDS